jgi:hypothetical protein
MATAKKDNPDLVRTERAKGAPEGAPLSTTQPKFAEPGPDVSNADLDPQSLSADAGLSTYVPNPDPNPMDLHPAPGPSTLQILGTPEKAGEDPANPAEEDR